MTTPKRRHRKTPAAGEPDTRPADIADRARDLGHTQLGPGKPLIKYTVAGIQRALVATKGNRAAAARALGISYDTLCRRFGRHPELLAFRESLLDRLAEEKFASNQQLGDAASRALTALVVSANAKLFDEAGKVRPNPQLSVAERWGLAEALRRAAKDLDAQERRRAGLAGDTNVLITQQTQTVFIDAHTPEQYATLRALPADVRQRIIDGDPRPLELLLPVSPDPGSAEAAPEPPEVAEGRPG